MTEAPNCFELRDDFTVKMMSLGLKVTETHIILKVAVRMAPVKSESSIISLTSQLVDFSLQSFRVTCLSCQLFD